LKQPLDVISVTWAFGLADVGTLDAPIIPPFPPTLEAMSYSPN
jgi:hypothetical protein